MSHNTRQTNFAIGGALCQLMQARLNYINKHGAKFLFDNTPPPAPGWPTWKRGRVQL